LRSVDGAKTASAAELAEAVIAAAPDGLTISGGEPMLQAAALAEMCRLVRKARHGINIIVFTGRLFAELTSADQKDFISQIDLLIDGEYVDELNDGVGLRGSSNQQLHFLTPVLLPYKQELLFGPRRREIHLLNDYEILTIGIPS